MTQRRYKAGHQNSKIIIAVGLQWPDRPPANQKYALGEPWPTIHTLLKQAAESARPRSGRKFVVKRLKAQAGSSTTTSVIAAIERADILVFNITETRRHQGRPTVPPNVLFEIGAAMGMRKPVVLIASCTKAHMLLPSDLAGRVVETFAQRLVSVGAKPKLSAKGHASIRAAIRRFSAPM